MGRPQEGANVVERTGQRYGHLTVLKRFGSKGTAATWLCQCDCGKEKVILSNVLRQAISTSSCGCARKTGKGSRPIYRSRHAPGHSARNAVLKGYRHAAKHRGLAWELTDTDFDIITTSQCFYCGSPPKNKRTTSRNGSFIYNGIDRIDNKLGYIPNNVLACCNICNHAKHTMSYDVFTTWIKQLVSHHLTHTIERTLCEPPAYGKRWG